MMDFHIQTCKKHKVDDDVSVNLTRCFEKVQDASLLEDLSRFEWSLKFFCAFDSCWLHYKKQKKHKDQN